jgi:hypothetical protein
MFELLKIKLFGHQPFVKISDKLLDALIVRDYKNNPGIVRSKLKNIKSDNRAAKNRISADILKLAGKDINALDGLIEKANEDCRDIMMWAEYPRCSKTRFDEPDKKSMKKIYTDDFIEYSNWLKKVT